MIRADTYQAAELFSTDGQIGFRWDWNGVFIIEVDMDQIDKMDRSRESNSALGAIELNQHYQAEPDLLNLQASTLVQKLKQVYTIGTY